jgi:putative oxidoreductase
MYSGTTSPSATGAGAGALVLRVGLGTMYLAHALLKLLVFGLDGTAGFFASIGLPGILAYAVFVTEFGGGVALITGFYARQVAAALVPILAGATWVHLANGWLFSNDGGGWEYPAFLIVASLALWLIGDGAFALKSTKRFAPKGI